MEVDIKEASMYSLAINLSKEEALVLMSIVGMISPKTATDNLRDRHGVIIDARVAGDVTGILYDLLYDTLTPEGGLYGTYR